MSYDFDLNRFVRAQDPDYATVLAELRVGEKRSHWMWYVFPQVSGLGGSANARRYAIASLDEARAYLRHAVLGPRLRECVELVLAVKGRAVEQIFPYPDDLKFRSSMTLFERAAPAPDIFALAIDQYYGGVRDGATIEILDSLEHRPR